MAFDDVEALAGLAEDKALLHQVTHGVADRDPANAEQFDQFAFRRQLAIAGQATLLDSGENGTMNLAMERPGILAAHGTAKAAPPMCLPS